MEPQSSPLSAKQVALGIATLVVGIVIGTAASFYFSYQAGFNAAKNLVEQSSLGGFLRAQSDERSMSGTVTAIMGDRLTLHSQSANPFDETTISDRTVLVAASTKVVKLTAKDSSVFQAEMAAFTKALQQSKPTTMVKGTPIVPPLEFPQMFSLAVVSASSIQVGDLVTATAAENIKGVSEFTAQEIQIQPQVSLK